MADWQTIKQAIMDEADKPNDATLVERALCESLRYLRGQRFWFNEGLFEIYTTADQWDYLLPGDFMSLIGQIFYTQTGNETGRRPLQPKTIDWMEEYRYVGGQWESHELTGPPLFYAIRGKELLIVPKPDTSDCKIDGRYLKDLGTPQEVYSGSAWSILAPQSTSTILATYTNEWFVTGYDLLKHRTLYVLYDSFYKDDAQATRHLQRFLEVKQRMQGEQTRRRASSSVRPYL